MGKGERERTVISMCALALTAACYRKQALRFSTYNDYNWGNKLKKSSAIRETGTCLRESAVDASILL